MSDESSKHLEEQACKLLLRSPRLSISQVLELMDISDAEFRVMLKRNTEIATLIEQRKNGRLVSPGSEAKECPICNDLFVPYASARYCSDACAQTAHLRTCPDSARRLRAKHNAAQVNKEPSNDS